MTAARIALVGPGAIGSTVAALLTAAGRDVLLCGRTPRDSIEVRPDPGVLAEDTPIVVPGPVRTDPDDVDGAVDVVLLAVKDTQNAGAASWLARLCDEHTVVCALQNGVEQVARVGAQCPTGSTAVPGLTVELSAEYLTETWRTLLTNALAGLMVLTGRRSGMFRREDVTALARHYVAECLAVAQAEGAVLGDPVIDETAGMFAGLPEDMTTSILTDHERGRPLEWDIRNGVILRKAREHGLPAPISAVPVPLLAAAGDGPG